MSDGWAPREFEVVRRGYEPRQVEETFGHLVRDLTVLRSERDALRRSCAELEARVDQLAAETGERTYRGLGDRVERILLLAEEEAAEVRQTTTAEVERERDEAMRAAESVRAEADAMAAQTRARVEADVGQLLDSARRQADTLREEAERFAHTRRGEVDSLLEESRAEAAQAAADFEIILTQRRESAERDFGARMTAAAAQVEAAEQRAATLENEVAELRADADRRAASTLAAASKLAEERIAAAHAQAEERIAQAHAEAERVRVDSERDLVAIVQRRDAINQHLADVRKMLAGLTGVAADDDPAGPGRIEPAGSGAGPSTTAPTSGPTTGPASESSQDAAPDQMPGAAPPAQVNAEADEPSAPPEADSRAATAAAPGGPARTDGATADGALRPMQEHERVSVGAPADSRREAELGAPAGSAPDASRS